LLEGFHVTQRIESPNEQDLLYIEAKRTWVRDHFEPQSRHEYDTLVGKLRLLDTIVSEKWIKPHETVKLQCLGITFGDALVQELGMRWVTIEDDQGRDPAIELPGTTVVAYPLTMISKRIERGEDVNVLELFNGICSQIREAASVADPKPESSST
jgi:hypothetical protein